MKGLIQFLVSFFLVAINVVYDYRSYAHLYARTLAGSEVDRNC